MNQVETLCDAVIEISELLLPRREFESVKSLINSYLGGNHSASRLLHGHVGQLLGIARSWSQFLSSVDLLTERDAALKKALRVRRRFFKIAF